MNKNMLMTHHLLRISGGYRRVCPPCSDCIFSSTGISSHGGSPGGMQESLRLRGQDEGGILARLGTGMQSGLKRISKIKNNVIFVIRGRSINLEQDAYP